MDLPPRSRLITSFKSHVQFFLWSRKLWLIQRKAPQHTPPCVFSHHFSLWFDSPCWVHYQKMLPVIQTTPAAELWEALPADSALPLIIGRFIVWQSKAIYLAEKCVSEQGRMLSGCPPNHLKIPEKTHEALLTSFSSKPLKLQDQHCLFTEQLPGYRAVNEWRAESAWPPKTLIWKPHGDCCRLWESVFVQPLSSRLQIAAE